MGARTGLSPFLERAIAKLGRAQRKSPYLGACPGSGLSTPCSKLCPGSTASCGSGAAPFCPLEGQGHELLGPESATCPATLPGCLLPEEPGSLASRQPARAGLQSLAARPRPCPGYSLLLAIDVIDAARAEEATGGLFFQLITVSAELSPFYINPDT